MEEKEPIDWKKVFLYFSGVQLLFIIILLYIAFGFIVTYGIIFVILLGLSLFSSFIAIKQTRNIRAAEVALQYVFDRIDGLALQIDHEIKDMVWAEDVPQVRRIVELMKKARKELLDAPLLFNGTVVEEIYNPSTEEIENEEQLREVLKGQLNDAALEMMAQEISNLRNE